MNVPVFAEGLAAASKNKKNRPVSYGRAVSKEITLNPKMP